MKTLKEKLDYLPSVIIIEETSEFNLDIHKEKSGWCIEYSMDRFTTLYPYYGYEKHNRCYFEGIDLENLVDNTIDWLNDNGYKNQF